MHAFAKPLTDITEVRRDEHGRILPSMMLPAHHAMQQLCEANTAFYRALDAHAATSGRQSPRSAPDSPVNRAVPQGFPSSSPSFAVNADPPPEIESKSLALPSLDAAPDSEPVTIFHSKALPRLTLFELAFALNRATQCGGDALMVALVLMWRYCVSTGTKPTAHMMHRLYVACLQLGVKTHSDVYYRNACYSKLAGITLAELNRLELEVLRGLNWHTLVQPVEVVALVMAPESLASPHLLMLNTRSTDKGECEFHDSAADMHFNARNARSLASSFASSWSKLHLATSASSDSIDGHYVACPTPPRAVAKAQPQF